MPVIPALQLKQVDYHEFQDSPGYRMRPYLKIRKVWGVGSLFTYFNNSDSQKAN